MTRQSPTNRIGGTVIQNPRRSMGNLNGRVLTSFVLVREWQHRGPTNRIRVRVQTTQVAEVGKDLAFLESRRVLRIQIH